MQALYGWLIANSDIKDVEKFYRADRNPKNYDVEYFIHLLHSIPANLAEIDAHITSCVDRPFKELDPIELTILRIATYEFQYSFDVPFKVVIHQAVDLAQMFGSEDSYKFINSVLDKMAHIMRPNEIQPVLEACN